MLLQQAWLILLVLVADAARPRRKEARHNVSESIRPAEGPGNIEVIDSVRFRRDKDPALRNVPQHFAQQGGNATSLAQLASIEYRRHPEEFASNNTAAPVQAPAIESQSSNSTNKLQLILEDFRQREPGKLATHLKEFGDKLDSDLVPSKEVASAGLSTTEQSEADGRGGVSLLAAAASAGWLPGVKVLISWNKSRIDGDSKDAEPLAPLILATKHGHSEVIEFLIVSRASPAIFDEAGLTPLEIAAKGCLLEPARALLGADGSRLAHGLKDLRVELAKQARNLPTFENRWPFGQLANAHRDYMDHMRVLVPDGFRPFQREVKVVGKSPSDWLLYYQNRVMSAYTDSEPCDAITYRRLGQLLSTHQFDTFAHDYAVSVALLALVLFIFWLMCYFSLRVRLFGWLDSPISLADSIPGAFDPVRYADPDFDPCRQKGRLPYRVVWEHLAPQSSNCGADLVFAGLALCGIYSSWSLQYVRIPPEKDPYDEDYMSDDDDNRREKVRRQAADRARLLRRVEVCIRFVVLVTICLWLLCLSQRIGDVAVLAFLYLYHACISACVASNMIPSDVPEKTPSDNAHGHGMMDADNIDAARVAHALFSVQHGPKWGRAICTTRSTATPNRTRLSRRSRLRRPQQKKRRGDKSSSAGEDLAWDPNKDDDETTAADAKSEGETEKDADDADKENMPVVKATSEPNSSDRFQRLLLRSGVLHTHHGNYLGLSVVSLLLIFYGVLWIFHLGRIAESSYSSFFDRMSPIDLVRAYGRPGTVDRFVSIILELLLMALCGEKLLEIANLLHVSTLTMDQRRVALDLVETHELSQSASASVASSQQDMQRLQESIRCSEFALELSSMRWLVLRESVLMVYICTEILLASSLVLLILPFIVPSLKLRSAGMVLDPMVPLLVSFTALWPLIYTMVSAVRANRSLLRIRDRLMTRLNEVLEGISSGKQNDDVPYVNLRIQVGEALQGSSLCWPGGRELGIVEPLFLVILAVTAWSLALTRAFVYEV